MIVVLVLLVTVFKALFGGSDDASAGVTPKPQSAVTTPTTAPSGPAESPPSTDASAPAAVDPTTVAPNGRCVASDVSLTPLVTDAIAGQTVPIAIGVKTRQATACVWRFAPRNVSVKVVRGDAIVWTSAACEAWIPEQILTLRAGSTVNVTVDWNGRRSDTGCREKYSDVATSGTYTAVASALGGTPEGVEFGLRKPTTSDIKLPSNKQSSGGATGQATPSDGASSPTTQRSNPDASPSGAVEPD